MGKKVSKTDDLAVRIQQLEAKRQSISQEISQLRKMDVAPAGCWIVRYQARGAGGTYWYYKWQSKEPIFVTKTGQKSCHKYIGKAGSKEFFRAVEMMLGRTKIEAFDQVIHTLELARMDLVEEAARYQKKKS
jgi:hypothetical protein